MIYGNSNVFNEEQTARVNASKEKIYRVTVIKHLKQKKDNKFSLFRAPCHEDIWKSVVIMSPIFCDITPR
jgi:hypothetical protein